MVFDTNFLMIIIKMVSLFLVLKIYFHNQENWKIRFTDISK